MRSRLAALTLMPDARQRGLALEEILNDLFTVDGLSVREAFTIRDESGQVQEQIDGLISLDGLPVLVEAKWHSKPIGQAEIARHLVRLYGRAGVMGLFVSASPYTDAALAECMNMLSQRVIALAEVNEILMLLEDPDANLASWLRGQDHRSQRGPQSPPLPGPDDQSARREDMISSALHAVRRSGGGIIGGFVFALSHKANTSFMASGWRSAKIAELAFPSDRPTRTYDLITRTASISPRNIGMPRRRPCTHCRLSPRC